MVGAFWYLISLERVDTCWRRHFNESRGSYEHYCGKGHLQYDVVPKSLNDSCPYIDPDDISDSKAFNFGIFIDALKSGVVASEDFPSKFFYCFWWGLRNLRLVVVTYDSFTLFLLLFKCHLKLIFHFSLIFSSLGQNLKTSTFVVEVVFAVGISIFGLVLFSLLIGNMQVIKCPNVVVS